LEYNSPAALSAGLLAGAIMLIPIYVGRMMMPDQMKMDLLKMLGTMMMPVSGMAYGIGLMIHAVMSLVFASAHAALYQWLDIDSSLVAWGLLFGAIHWVGVGIAFGMIKASIHRGIRDGAVEAPGFFGLNLGMMTAMGVLIVHLLFGLLVGAFYEGFA
jgi:hypothetical protein